jgi:hypothetical protein
VRNAVVELLKHGVSVVRVLDYFACNPSKVLHRKRYRAAAGFPRSVALIAVHCELMGCLVPVGGQKQNTMSHEVAEFVVVKKLITDAMEVVSSRTPADSRSLSQP